MDEQAAAIHALGKFVLSVHFKLAFDILDETVEFFYYNIRIQTLYCYRYLIEGYTLFKHNEVLTKFNKDYLLFLILQNLGLKKFNHLEGTLQSINYQNYQNLKDEQLNFILSSVKGVIQNQQYKTIIKNIVLNVQDQEQKNREIAFQQQ